MCSFIIMRLICLEKMSPFKLVGVLVVFCTMEYIEADVIVVSVVSNLHFFSVFLK